MTRGMSDNPIAESDATFAASGAPCPLNIDSAEIIRGYLTAGKVQDLHRFLGRPWSINGTVVHGDKRGRLLGFPTANIILDANIRLAYGIYAVRVQVNGAVENGVACFGTRPQFDDGAPRLEIHILDFSQDIYGNKLVVEFIAYQRSETAFVSVEALVSQIAEDCLEARRLLAQPQVSGDRSQNRGQTASPADAPPHDFENLSL